MLGSLYTSAQMLEAAMLICFGLSWPISSLKAWRTKFVRGKSPVFMLLVFTGYMAGLASKLVRAAHHESAPEWTTFMYAFNAAFVALDLALYVRYRHNHEPVTRELARDLRKLSDEGRP